MNDVLEIAGALGLAIVITAVVVCLIAAPIIAIDCKSQIELCKQIDGTDINHEWSFWTGCRVERPNGMWVNINDYYTSELILNLQGE